MTEVAFDRVLAALVGREVDFVLVGGLALGSWGVVRGTKDVEVVPDREPENLRRLAEVAVDLGGYVQAEESLAGSAISILALLQRGERVFIETPLGPIDVVQDLKGVPPYGELAARSVEASLLGTRVRVCSLEDLRAMKRAAGRPRDLVDLSDLDDAHGAD